MKRVTALVSITVLAILAGCAKKETPAASAAEDEDDGVATSTQPAPPVAKSAPIVERSKSAAEMVALIDPGPQCQQYRDALETAGKTPGTMDELNDLFVAAYRGGCGKPRHKKQ